MENKLDYLLIDDTKYDTEVPERYVSKEKKEAVNKGDIRSIIPGVIVDIKVRKGEKVAAGDVVVVLEAMKMYNDIEAESDGAVAEILISEGDKVAKDQLMIRLT